MKKQMQANTGEATRRQGGLRTGQAGKAPSGPLPTFFSWLAKLRVEAAEATDQKVTAQSGWWGTYLLWLEEANRKAVKEQGRGGPT
jgi:hypothetical protein